MVKLNKFLAICLISSKTFIFAVLKCNGTLAQLVEQRTENPCVRSSILRGTTKNLLQWRFFYIFKLNLNYEKNNIIYDYNFFNFLRNSSC